MDVRGFLFLPEDRRGHARVGVPRQQVVLEGAHKVLDLEHLAAEVEGRAPDAAAQAEVEPAEEVQIDPAAAAAHTEVGREQAVVGVGKVAPDTGEIRTGGQFRPIWQ